MSFNIYLFNLLVSQICHVILSSERAFLVAYFIKTSFHVQKYLLSIYTFEILNISTVFCLLSFVVTKKNSGVEHIFTYTSLSQFHYKGKPGQELKHGRNLEAGTKAEVMEKWCLLVCSSSITQLPPLFNPDRHLQRTPSTMGLVILPQSWI